VIDSLGDTNVTLAGELADLDTAVAVDDPPQVLRESLGILEDEAQTLGRRFDELHAIERRLARGLAQTVGFVAGGGNRRGLMIAGHAFDAGYKERL
jgi:hypothetical protein